MNRLDELEKMAKENGGVLLTSAIVAAGISKPTLADFVKKMNMNESDGAYTAHRSAGETICIYFNCAVPRLCFRMKQHCFCLI